MQMYKIYKKLKKNSLILSLFHICVYPSYYIMVKTFVQCLICKQKFKCSEKSSVLECAKHYKMKKIKIENINAFICENCYFKLLKQ